MPSNNISDFKLSDFDSARKIPNYSLEKKVLFLDALGKALLCHPDISRYPDLASFGFFCSKRRLMSELGGYSDDMKIPLGLVTHITPNNVPLNFAMSFVFGFISGNANVVKIPETPLPQIKIFLDVLGRVSDSTDAFEGQHFISGLREKEYFRRLVNLSDGLLVWGGDETIAAVRKLERSPRSVLWEFPSRFSISIICGAQFLRMSKVELERIVLRFYGDAMSLDQNACSSPKYIAWLNTPESCISLFWNCFDNLLEKKQNPLSPSRKMLRMASMVDCSIVLGEALTTSMSKPFERISVSPSELTEGLFSANRGLGMFFESRSKSVSDLEPILKLPKLQTVTYYGIDKHVISQFVKETANIFGVDRIVPLGRALDFSLVWDGRFCLDVLTRKLAC